MESPRVFALILAGGAGTRFWPASRTHRPKQLLPLCSAHPMILDTAERMLPLCGGWGGVLVASGAHLEEATQRALPELPAANLLLEPVPRNTAPCIAWAAAIARRRDPEAIVVVAPSDHAIDDVPGYRRVLLGAIESAKRGAITTVGIRPTHPETGFGYIELAAPVSWDPAPEPRAVRGVRFVEKPDLERARSFVEGGRHLWNAGMFIFRAADMLAAIEAHLPELAEGVRAFDEAAARGDESQEVARRFGTLPAISIDFGIMEKLDGLSVVPGDFGWSDVGSWQSAWELADKDDAGNTRGTSSVFVNASNNHVVDLRAGGGGERVIALVGVDDLVVVETDDALLVVRRGQSQDVREVVEHLKRAGRPMV